MTMFIALVQTKCTGAFLVNSPFVQPGTSGVPRTPFQAPASLASALEPIAQSIAAQPGDCVMTAGTPADGLYLVTSGTVRAHLPAEDGRGLVCRILGPGSLLGLPAAMCAKSYQFTAEAVDHVSLRFVETAAFNEMLRQHPELCMQVLGMMGDELNQLRQTQEHMMSCTKMDCALHGACTCRIA